MHLLYISTPHKLLEPALSVDSELTNFSFMSHIRREERERLVCHDGITGNIFGFKSLMAFEGFTGLWKSWILRFELPSPRKLISEALESII